jgi:hypothetical protein
MEETLAEALATGMIVRITRRVEGERLINVGQAWSRTAKKLRIRTLEDRRYQDIPLSEVTVVEIIGVYLKDYEV